MSAVMRRYLTAGAALAGAGLIAVTPVAPVMPSPTPHTADLDVRLTSDGGSLLNIPYNLFADIVNIPYVLFSRPYSLDGLIPQFATNDQAVLPGADYPAYDGPGEIDGALNNLGAALQYTGSWWLSSPTNVWGWDTGNPWNFTALINMLPIPALAEPLAKNLNILAAAEFPEAEGCAFTCPNLAGELDGYLKVPTSQLISGYTFPDPATNPVSGLPEIWSGTTVHLDPSFGLDSFFQSLMADPADNPVELPSISDIFTSVDSFLQGFWKDFEVFTLFLNPNSLLWAFVDKFLGIVPWDVDIPDPVALSADTTALPADLSAVLANTATDIDALLGV